MNATVAMNDRNGQTQPFPIPAPKIGVWLLLAAMTLLFSLLLSAYVVRMGQVDWISINVPTAFFGSTGLLVAGSLTAWLALRAIRAGDARRSTSWLAVTLGLTVLFLVAQVFGWQQLLADGVLLSTNPSASFIYLMSGLHGAHVIGGIVALQVVLRRGRSGQYSSQDHLGIELTGLYLHFMLGVWVLMFILLSLT